MEILVSPGFGVAVAATVVRGLLGFGLSVVAGVGLGAAAGLSRTLFRMLEPGMAVVRAVPVISVILLALIWFTSDAVPVFVCVLMTTPVLYGNVVAGIRAIDPDLVVMARVYRVSPVKIARDIYLPSILPHMVAGFSVSLGLTWKVVVAAEVLSQPLHAVGSNLQEAKVALETASVLAWTVVAVLLSGLSEGLLRHVERKLTVWRPT